MLWAEVAGERSKLRSDLGSQLSVGVIRKVDPKRRTNGTATMHQVT